MIFHLKRFIFTSSGSQKLFKHIYYTMEMEIAKGRFLVVGVASLVGAGRDLSMGRVGQVGGTCLWVGWVGLL